MKSAIFLGCIILAAWVLALVINVPDTLKKRVLGTLKKLVNEIKATHNKTA